MWGGIFIHLSVLPYTLVKKFIFKIETLGIGIINLLRMAQLPPPHTITVKAVGVGEIIQI